MHMHFDSFFDWWLHMSDTLFAAGMDDKLLLVANICWHIWCLGMLSYFKRKLSIPAPPPCKPGTILLIEGLHSPSFQASKIPKSSQKKSLWLFSFWQNNNVFLQDSPRS
ncbi:uncharacterized protein LOC126653460 [Mercurialis annua]|uniref:uncharacterized protein LOC126653460 n=1 Tax=Mercurialis annua TaxID=3986 RepID=UPI00215F084C|nr:uncharacterized protein LOC126653460 [Mercurialis annua]